jgi:serine/threonine-protein kinase
MGMVHLALRLADGVAVALKTILPARDVPQVEVQRFLREAKVLQQLSHPNIVAFRDMGESAGRLFFAMDLVRGKDAAALLREGAPMPVGRAVGLVCQLLTALEYAHGRGFVHRDIKPANLLVTKEADGEKAPLVDFGLVRVYQESRLSGLSMAGQVAGTAAFMPPEQVTNYRGAQPTADQYAAAATLYNLLTDRYVYDFPAAFHERLLLILQEKPVPIRTRRPDVPEELARVIHRALAREPEERFADVAAMRAALVGFSQQTV